MLQGFPVHRLQFNKLSEQDLHPLQQKKVVSFRLLQPLQDINDLAGNAMHLRSMAAAWLIAFKASEIRGEPSSSLEVPGVQSCTGL